MTIKVLDWGGNQQSPIGNALSVHKSVENIHYIHFPKNCFNVVISALQGFAIACHAGLSELIFELSQETVAIVVLLMQVSVLQLCTKSLGFISSD